MGRLGRLCVHVLVIGGGVIGATTAYFLTEAGHEVTLVDRQPSLAAEGSFANGGMVHASHTEPWNTPAAIRQLVRWIGREESPLLLRPSQIPNLIGWGLGFLRYSSARHHERSTRVNTRLAVYSQRMLADIRARTGIDYEAEQRGIMKIFRDRAELEHAITASALTESLGVRYEALDVDGVVAREPALADVRDELAGGIYYPDDESGDAHLFTEALAAVVSERGGSLRLGEQVLRLEGGAGGVDRVVTDQGEITADRYVLAAGVEAPVLAKPLGVRLPIKPVKGYSATLPAAGHPGVPATPIIDEGQKVVITRLGERLRVAGTAEFAGYDRSIRQRRVEIVVRQALANFPQYAGSVDTTAAEPWACLRPMTMDGPPLLGASGVPNLLLNTGPGHLGWTFAAGAGRVVADLVDERTPEIDLEGLTLARYRR
ncbi:D-amino acid dehydrogenase [Arhodomonas sp. AD133]|uniref:D-amino acid dehydrogenase n=1 Tax=Arhodomonas sp. AD133 TaxID=3415009 RepID=UPI003EB7E877